VEAVRDANAAVIRQAHDDPDLRGMGTTLSALALVVDDGSDVRAVAHVGDSRLYLLRADGAELEQITLDHSLVATLEREGQITAAEAAVHPKRNIITRALGIEANVLVDSFELLPVAGDRYLICSDGLFNEVADDKIAAVLRRLADPHEAADELVRQANDGGGRDNISVVIVDVVEADTAVTPATGDESRVRAVVLGEHRGRREAVSADAPTIAQPAVEAAGGDADAPSVRAAATTSPARPRSRVTWRVGVFVLALLALVALTFGAVTWIARNTYFVGYQDDVVAVFQGQPDGTLWIQPEVVELTDIGRDDVPAAADPDLDAGQEQSSLEDAQRYVENLRDQIASFEESAGAIVGGAVEDVPADGPTTLVPPTSVTPTTLAPPAAPPGLP
jgi:protein phosphatase